LLTLLYALPSSTCVNRGFSNIGNNKGNNYGNGNANPRYLVEPKVYPQQWTQLAYLSLLMLLLDWMCFSIAASPDSFEAAYSRVLAAHLIDIFHFTNVASCFHIGHCGTVWDGSQHQRCCGNRDAGVLPVQLHAGPGVTIMAAGDQQSGQSRK
jgi:hypothetical protein